jgi:hypothetical protein
VPNIDEFPSLNLKVFFMAISSSLQRVQDLVHGLLIHIISPAMMINS